MMLNRLFIFLTLIMFFSCEEQGLLVKCPDCTPDEPVDTYLEIKLDSEYHGTNILINVYEGNLEDSILYSSYNVSSPSISIPVTLNKKYTITSTYYLSDKYYIAVDSATPRVKYDKYQCDEPCYFVYDRIINLRLKY